VERIGRAELAAHFNEWRLRNRERYAKLGRGGRNDWTNLAVAGGGCNRSKGMMAAEEFFQAMKEEA
jgi:hypothetical protein